MPRHAHDPRDAVTAHARRHTPRVHTCVHVTRQHVVTCYESFWFGFEISHEYSMCTDYCAYMPHAHIHGQYILLLRIVLYSSYSYSVCLVSGGVNNTVIQNTEYGIRGLTLVLRIQDRPYWERVWSVPIHNTEYDTEYGPAPSCTCRRAVAPTRQVKPVRLGTGIVRCIRIPYSVCILYWGRQHSLAVTVWRGFRILYSYSVFCIGSLSQFCHGFRTLYSYSVFVFCITRLAVSV